MSQLLQYNYAAIDTASGICLGCLTTSDEINHEAYVLIPEYNEDYIDKYYNLNGDQKWYWDAAFTQLWVECPSH